MTVEGIELTPEMIDNIRYWQANPEHIDGVAKVFDRAIATIAQDDPAAVGKEAQTRLMLISDLCFIKSNIVSFGIKKSIR